MLCNIAQNVCLLSTFFTEREQFTAFYVTSTTFTVGPTPLNPFAFDVRSVSYGDGFNESNANLFTCPDNGVFWFFYTCVARDLEIFMFINTTNDVALSVLQVEPTSFLQTESRSAIFKLTTNKQLMLLSHFPIYADINIASSWGAFRIDNIMFPLVAFDVRAITNFTLSMQHVNVQFEEIRVNEGKGWLHNHFYAPFDGLYYFNIEVSIIARRDAHKYAFIAYLVDGKFSESCLIPFAEATAYNNGHRQTGRSCFIKLSAGELIHFVLQYVLSTTKGPFSAKDTSLTITFRGLLYSPLNGHTVAWQVMNDTLELESGEDKNNNFIKFHDIVINTGVLFDSYQVFVWQIM